MSTDLDPRGETAVSPFGRTVGAHAQRLQLDPSAIIRWVRKGFRLRTGDRAYLKAAALPGGYRIRDEDLAAFIDQITADKLGRGDATESAVRTPAARNRAADAARAELKRAGF